MAITIQFNGTGTYKFKNGDLYTGGFRDSKFVGKGVIVTGGNRCEGEFSNGELNGKAICKYQGGEQFTGEFKNGDREGKGVFTSANGNKIEGTWKAGKMQ